MNWRTTVLGLLAAIVIYEASVGNKIPSNRQEWWAFGIGVLAILVGSLLKDPEWLRKVTGGSVAPKVLAFACLVPMLSSCMAGFGYRDMDPQQIAAAVKDKTAGISCAAGTYAGARVNMLFINNDRGLSTEMTIDTDCKATFRSPATVTPTK